MRCRDAVLALVPALLTPGVHAQTTTLPAARVTIEAAQTRAAVSPLVYGQFIEHLGRCIYGGLWAEMLEDRKFYYPVTGEMPAWEMFTPGPRSYDGEGHPYELLMRSPWLVLGDKKAVSMERQGALAGEHSPRIAPGGPQAPAGLAQERLVLQEGHEYVGRVVLAGDTSAGPIEISLTWGGGASDRQTIVVRELSAGWTAHALRFRAQRRTDNGRLEIVGRGSGAFRVGAVSLMPADNVLGWRRDTLARLRELDSPVYRWPGGNFVSGYDWKDGIGDPDRRPPRKNPAWKGIEHNDVGLHEFMDLCLLIDSQPYVAVNTGLGGARSAAELVEYANGAQSTMMGRLRAQHGHARPFAVKLWAVGNEMYGDWQLGHMPLEKYVAKHREFVDAMRAVDPSIRPVGVGALGEWSRTMLAQAANAHGHDQRAPLLAVQGRRGGPRGAGRATPSATWPRPTATYARELPSLKGRPVKVALDEWNYWYGPNEYGELGTRYFLKDGLGIAAGLHRDGARLGRVRDGELRPDRQRHRRHQDHGDRGRAGADRAGARALPPALRHAASGRLGRSRPARRGRGLDRRSHRADRGCRQPGVEHAVAGTRDRRCHALPRPLLRPHRRRAARPQRPGPARGVTLREGTIDVRGPAGAAAAQRDPAGAGGGSAAGRSGRPPKATRKTSRKSM